MKRLRRSSILLSLPVANGVHVQGWSGVAYDIPIAATSTCTRPSAKVADKLTNKVSQVTNNRERSRVFFPISYDMYHITIHVH